jgi:universal stress protein A
MEISMNVKSVLVPIDFSDCALEGWDYAIKLFKGSDIQYHALYVVEPIIAPAELYSVWPYEEKQKEYAEQRFVELKKSGRFCTDKITSSVVYGHAHEAIIKYAEEQGVDMIVMSTHGHRGLNHFMLGSTAERVVRGAKNPVLTMKPVSK